VPAREVVPALMKAGMNVDTTNDNGETMLFVAVATGHVDGMWALVKAGAT
jgi:hypothetical protein